jgi:hypothetical protein
VNATLWKEHDKVICRDSGILPNECADMPATRRMEDGQEGFDLLLLVNDDTDQT